jgi:hypothetical protein
MDGTPITSLSDDFNLKMESMTAASVAVESCKKIEFIMWRIKSA